MIRASWRFFRHHPWQLGLALLSIALGAAVIIAVDLANQSAAHAFNSSVNVLSGKMTHELIAMHGRSLDSAFYRQLRSEWGVRNAAPLIEFSVTHAGVQYAVLGVDPFAVPFADMTSIPLPNAELGELLTRPNSVLVPQALATRLKVGTGQTFDVQVQQQNQALFVAATLPVQGAAAELMVMDIANAQALTGANLTRIQLKLTEVEAVQLQARLPSFVKLQSFQQKQVVFAQMTQAFSTNLLAMSLLAMLVGAFLVYNTMTFSVLQRRSTFAIARMVGVTGAQLFRHLVGEACVLGLVGGTLGVVLGIGLGQGLLLLVTQTLSDLYANVQATEVWVTPSVLLKSLGITLFSVLVATLAPALEAARVSPILVKRQSSLEVQQQRMGRVLFGVGVCMMLGSWALLSGFVGSLVWGFVGLFVLIIGYSLCVPWVLRWVLNPLQRAEWLKAHLSLTLAVRSVLASLSRTSLAIIALSVAVAATVGVSMMIGSFRTSVTTWLETTLSSDVYVSAVAEGNSRVVGVLNPQWLTRVAQLEAVQSLSTGLSTQIEVDNVSSAALILQTAAHSAKGFNLLHGGATTWSDFERGDGILVSEPFAYHRHKNVGDVVTLNTPKGKQTVRILGVFRDYSATQGMFVMERRLYTRFWDDARVSSIGLKLKPTANADAVLAQLTTWSAQFPQTNALSIKSSQQIRTFSLGVFDRTFMVTNVLRILVIIVAFVGVFSALMALFLEKGRDLAILRATGFTPLQIKRLVRAQAIIMGGLAGVLAVPLGVLMSMILIDIINQRSFGWTMQHTFFVSLPFQAVLLATVAAWLASLYPVKRLDTLRLPELIKGA